jgi:hypothetical protein
MVRLKKIVSESNSGPRGCEHISVFQIVNRKTSCSGILGHGILYGAETEMMGNSSRTYN